MSNSLQLVKAIYDAFAKGDVPTFLGHLDPGIVWNEAEGFPYADRNPYVGIDALVAGVFARLAEDWADFRVVPGEIVGGPEVVTVLGRYQGTCKATGRPLDVQCAHIWWLRGGKAVRFQQMVDTAGVARALA
ncbi:MAG: nuclear transport factor 2 family protein [Planctomycetes bacterium]|nr:nuclear transport factor 2 family protein [Planctomycetota bacterium]